MRPYPDRRSAHLRLGQRGERLAASLLRELGLEVLLRNYSCPAGEIDIVARDGEVLCFVEVKTRRRVGRARPAAAVGTAKRKRIARTARRYLHDLSTPDLLHRFDIVEIVLDGWSVRDARYWPRAFTPGDKAHGGLSFPSLVDESGLLP